MAIPVIHDFPVKRPGFIKTAEWVGGDESLKFRIAYDDTSGTTRFIEFNTRSAVTGDQGEICLPTSNDLHDLGVRYEDILTAHTRMACLVSRSGIPGSDEFLDALLNGESSNLQTALGVVKVVDVQAVDGQTIAMTYKQGTGPSLSINQEYQNLNNYVFVPDTQLFVVPGAVKKQFPTYVHDYPNVILTEARRDEIAAYVLTLEPWI
jgi:hypothetical protein